jgi:hypothetical protein
MNGQVTDTFKIVVDFDDGDYGAEIPGDRLLEGKEGQTALLKVDLGFVNFFINHPDPASTLYVLMFYSIQGEKKILQHFFGELNKNL